MATEQIIQYEALTLKIRVPDANNFEQSRVHIEKALTRLYAMTQQHAPFLTPEICTGLLEGLAKRLDRLTEFGLSLDADFDVTQFHLILNKITENFIDASNVALTRMVRDKDIICKLVFKDENIDSNKCTLLNLEVKDSDPHHHGKSVIVGEVQNGHGQKAKFVYKPSSILIDMMITGDTAGLSKYGLANHVLENYKVANLPESLMEMLAGNSSCYLICPQVDPTIDGGNPLNLSTHYGYIEYLPHGRTEDNISNDLDVRNKYSEHAGLITALATMFGMQDVHGENVLVSFLILYLIDLENSLIPSPPNPLMTVLFDENAGGFYGRHPSMYNRFYPSDNTRASITIEPEAFKRGVERAITLFSGEENPELNTWLNHRLMEVMPIRIVPFETNFFREERDYVLISAYRKKALSEIALLESMRQNPALKLDEAHPENTFSDEGIPQIIAYGDENAKKLLASYKNGDIPAYHMFVISRHLLDPEHQPIILPNANNPLNYFLHTPLQAMQAKLAVLQKNPAYIQFTKDYIYLLLETLNARDLAKKILQKRVEIYNNAASVIYQLLDCAQTLNNMEEHVKKDIAMDLNDMVSFAEHLITLCERTSQLTFFNNDEKTFVVAFEDVIARSKKLLTKHAKIYQDQVLLQNKEPPKKSVDYEYLYQDNDISTCLEAAINTQSDLGRHGNFTYLLQSTETDKKYQDGKQRYIVAVTSAIDTFGTNHVRQFSASDVEGVSSINLTYHFDKTTRPKDELEDLIARMLAILQETNNIDDVRQFIGRMQEEKKQRLETLTELLEKHSEPQQLQDALLKKLAEIQGPLIDVFDEIMPLLKLDNENNAKILFPYNIAQHHWLVGEILINRKGNQYTVTLHTHVSLWRR